LYLGIILIVVNRFLTFIAWSLSALSLIFLLGALSMPGAGKIFSLAFVGWFLIFLPPLWIKTLRYGLLRNITFRTLAFFILPIIFMATALANGYQPSEGARVDPIVFPKSVETNIKPTPSVKTSSSVVNLSPTKKEIVDPEKKMANYYNSLPAKMSINGKVITLYCYEPSALYFQYEGTMYAVNGTALGMGNPDPSRQYKERSDDIGIFDVTEISKKARLLCGL
jgi:hypothetical protein